MLKVALLVEGRQNQLLVLNIALLCHVLFLTEIGARHSPRVSGAADNMILGRQTPIKCPVSRNAKCEMSGF
eukprot:COSAG06_NODE_20144_length_806_cov_2.933522_1_plen_70_part_10